MVYATDLGSPAQRREPPDLVVLDFAQRAAPLPRHSHRLRPFLRAAALVDQLTAIGLTPP